MILARSRAVLAQCDASASTQLDLGRAPARPAETISANLPADSFPGCHRSKSSLAYARPGPSASCARRLAAALGCHAAPSRRHIAAAVGCRRADASVMPEPRSADTATRRPPRRWRIRPPPRSHIVSSPCRFQLPSRRRADQVAAKFGCRRAASSPRRVRLPPRRRARPAAAAFGCPRDAATPWSPPRLAAAAPLGAIRRCRVRQPPWAAQLGRYRPRWQRRRRGCQTPAARGGRSAAARYKAPARSVAAAPPRLPRCRRARLSCP